MTFPAYPGYKDSEITWIGDVPVSWEVKPFKWLLSNNDGGVWGDDPTGEGDTFVLRSTDQTVDGNWKLTDPAPRKLSAKEKASALLVEGDLVVTKSSGSSLHIGKTTLVTADIAKQGCCYGNFMQRLRVNSGFTPKLAWYVMNNELARAQLDLLSNSTTGLANLNGTLIGEILLPVSSVAEQTQIARFLDHETARIDALIEEQQRLIELLKEKRQAVISHAVTKGLDPTMPMKDSGAEWLGEVPAHWETLRIGAVYSEAADKGLAELPVLRVSIHHGVSDKELSEEESDRKITRIDDREKYKRVRAGDLVYNMMRAWQGGFGAVLVDGLVSPAYVVARPKNEDISRYVEQLLRTGCAVEEMRKNSYGITDFRLRLYWDQFKNIVIVIPPEVERQQIMERIDSLINESEALKSEADRLIVILQERRSALISAAVTGKIDVRGWQPPARAQAPVLEAEVV